MDVPFLFNLNRLDKIQFFILRERILKFVVC